MLTHIPRVTFVTIVAGSVFYSFLYRQDEVSPSYFNQDPKHNTSFAKYKECTGICWGDNDAETFSTTQTDSRLCITLHILSTMYISAAVCCSCGGKWWVILSPVYSSREHRISQMKYIHKALQEIGYNELVVQGVLDPPLLNQEYL